MQCDETISHMVTEGRSYFRTLRNACVTAGKPHDCRQNVPWLLWNALLTTPYVSEHFKYMFLVARNLYEMFVLYRGEHTNPALNCWHLKWSTSISCDGHKHTVGRRPVLGQVSRQPALDVIASRNTGVGGGDVGVQPHPCETWAFTNLQNRKLLAAHRAKSLFSRNK